MRKRKALILFTMVAATIALLAYTHVEASVECVPGQCVALKGFEIRTAGPPAVFYDDTLPNTTTFNYEVKKVSGKSKIKFIDVLVPGSIDPTNVETWFRGVKVNNEISGMGEGADPPSRAWAGISDGRALRAYINKKLKTADGWVTFSVKFLDQARVKSGSTYLQLTEKASSNYASGRIPGPDEQAVGEIGESIFETIPLGPEEGPPFLCADYENDKFYNCTDNLPPFGNPNNWILLPRRPIQDITVKIKVPTEINANGFFEGPMSNVSNRFLGQTGDGTCYPWCYNGGYYLICEQ